MRSRSLPDRACLAPAAFAAFVAASSCASSGAAQTIVEKTAASCRPITGVAFAGFTPAGRIAPAEVRKALEKDYPIVPEWSVDDKPLTNGELIAKIARAGLNPGAIPAASTNRATLFGTGRSVADWMGLPYEQGKPYTVNYDANGLSIRRRDGGAATTADLEPVLAHIFLGKDSGFDFYCKSATGAPEAPAVPPRQLIGKGTWTVAKGAEDLGKGGSDDQKAGELGFTDDKAGKATTYATDVTAGFAFPFLRGGEPNAFRRWSLAQANLIPFVAYKRQGGKDTADDSYVNTLSAGIAHNGYLVLRTGDPKAQPADIRTFSTFYSISVRQETDDKFESDASFVQLSLQPLLPLPGNTIPAIGSGDDPTEVSFVWTAKAVADYSYVDDPWEKKALIKTSKYARLGVDLDATLIVRPPFKYGDWKMKASAAYARREDIRKGSGGDADLATVKLTFEPTKTYSFALGYERGKDLTSLAKDRRIKLTIELKH
ncbi:MAG: hypothetical protein KKE02_22915 [Alphaproteobacteria bacterium]|nr:hypothetical protein [Alphaproteobacteria bacterium]MBU1516361.1 hypothetical protein [Alphaproteobacteria bacterium]MBU2093402.1 hypothetical protein [Alphaproteobacteria bacterium]MBU2153889.1 hypothetical protein [Alphaproteobacteria bacterium]MBU2307761.1 hypothetical protein [Alphaproteobacteria bacterium]